jgi:hypothetical protein
MPLGLIPASARISAGKPVRKDLQSARTMPDHAIPDRKKPVQRISDADHILNRHCRVGERGWPPAIIAFASPGLTIKCSMTECFPDSSGE